MMPLTRLWTAISQMRSFLTPLALSFLVVLAGCGSSVPNGSDTTAAPGDPPTDPVLTEHPPGTDTSGIVAPRTVLGTHASILANTSYAIHASQTSPDLEAGLGVTVRSALDQRRAYAKGTGSGPLAGTALYITESRVYIKRSVDGGDEYASREPTVPFAAQHRRQLGHGYIEAVLSAGRFESDGQTTVDGIPVWAFELGEPRNSSGPFANASGVDGRVLIDERGIIRVAALEAVLEGPDREPVSMTVEYRTLGVDDVTVDEPAWLPEARAQTSGTT